MNEEQIKEIFSDKTYVQTLLELDTAEEVQASLAEKGLNLSTTEITTLLDSLQKYAEAGGELSEDDLETVTGGMFTFVMLIIAVATGILGGAVAADHSAREARRRW
jgi:hypothetical protein